MMSLFKSSPIAGVDINYELYLQRYRLLHDNLDHLGLLANAELNQMMTKSEFDLVTKKIVASFDCTNLDYAELLRELFNKQGVSAYISDEIVPKMIFVILNIEGFEDKITNAFASISSTINQTITARINLKLLPVLTDSLSSQRCPSELINDVRTEINALLTQLNVFLQQNNIKSASQVLTKLETLITCVAPHKPFDKKIAEFRQWQEDKNQSPVMPGFGR